MPNQNNIAFLKDNDIVIIALSGGPDSMCLLTLLNEIKTIKKITIIAAYVNHQARKTCYEEEKFVKEYCQHQNIPLELYTIKNYQKGKFTEEEARHQRYAFFQKVYQKYQATYLLTAHHGDDLIETILMKILRGSTLDSLTGIKSTTTYQQMTIKRPLLNVTKENILKYLQNRNIPYIIDETNYEDIHLRNRLRKSVIPNLKKEDNNIHLKFLKFSEELTELIAEEQNQLNNITRQIKKNNQTNLSEFLKLSPFFQKEYLKKEFKQYYNNEITKINSQIINQCLNFLQKNHKTYLKMPAHNLLIKNNNYFYLTKDIKNENFCIKCENKVILPNGGIVKKINQYTEKSNFEIHLNSQDIKLPLYITNRLPGMKMSVKNLSGTKKVKDILIDAKIPQPLKDKIPILIDSNNTVLWILGIKKSQLDKQENYDIIYKYEKEG